MMTGTVLIIFLRSCVVFFYYVHVGRKTEIPIEPEIPK